MIIADDLVKNHKAQIDFAKLLGNALVHDIEENGTGDLLRSTKHYNHEITSAMKKVEDEVAKGISQDITGGPLLYNRWKTAKDPKTLEGQIVALADILTVVAYTLEELSMGNQSMRSVLNEVYNTLQDIIEGGDKTITNKQVMKYVMDTAVVLDLYRNLKETNL
jgi:5'-deoxynucleotidase YfbR-like HD superfamily hydrolase